MPDMIRDREVGVVVEPFDVAALAGAIRWVVDEPGRHAELSRRARELAEREYAQEVQARRYVEIYEGLLAPGARQRRAS
jgi:glycosyltransferase involved in cell wall biosynthesis